MLCRNCKQKMKQTTNGSFDAFAFMTVNPFYCINKDCEEFGYVVMVGYPEKDNQELDNIKSK